MTSLLLPDRPRVCVDRPRFLPGQLIHPESLAGRSAEHAALVTSARWKPGQEVRVGFLDKGDALIAEALAAQATWMRRANVHFTRVMRGDAEIRVTFDPNGGSWSYIGTEALTIPGGAPTMNLGWPDDLGRTLHEYGHALGLIHEHQNPLAPFKWNLPAVYRFYGGPPNYWSPQEIQDQVINRYADPMGLTNGGFDPLSIMLYATDASLLMDPADATVANEVLSSRDEILIGSPGWYPFDVIPPATGTDGTSLTNTTTVVMPGVPAPAPPAPVVPAPLIPNPGDPVSEALALISEALTFVNGEINFAVLEQVVVDAEVKSPGLQSAIAAVQANEDTIFENAVARFAGNAMLSLLSRTHAVGKASA